ncbi:phosphocholine-specific phospholipase C [Arcticibacter eurypsychrophilus]|uniref:phosphocholine-specific phospholipase C n=1 Tax=Arcticibacter eurypsychrophilus TaxID=1434752 RepID=UPI00084E07C3|nr:phospholipase C, phosphocholine-specific [Arcticibacter eurypsychrophilus]
MNESRRVFIKKAGLLTGAAGLFSIMPASIQQALAIDAAAGSTYMDAEHVVFLMQENRSFDHCFGTLNGVRGFNDPRAIHLANNNPVWLQTNASRETYAPFRLNLKDTKSTWMSSLPHSWENQVDALNGGKMDKWLESKKSGNKEFANMPLTMGYYNRTDIPFYYALADAFTVCDQHFCSALTGTSPNRLFFWTGTLRAEQDENSKAHIWNDEIDHKDIHWTTFPERLEDLGISWKAYQNELSIPVGFQGEEEDWLANFTDNDLEFFSQFNVRLHVKHLDFLTNRSLAIQKEVIELRDQLKVAPGDGNLLKILQEKEQLLKSTQDDMEKWNKQRFEQLSERDKSIHRKAFVTNSEDPDYHQLVEMDYMDDDVTRKMKVPKGDVLHQFRQDVDAGQLPAVSWLVPSSHFSDHPGSPWYGAWYISEVMDILTKNPETWKKTIFIITYDENDGYFDHVPPFLPPHSARPDTGKVSNGIDTRVEHVSLEQEKQRGFEDQRESPIGLGFRVPMLVVSPWTKGGWVNSQVFDHTSNLQFLEHWLSKKTGKKLNQPEISDWRRVVCGDLTSVFRPSPDKAVKNPAPVEKDVFIQSIHKAQFKALPSGYTVLREQDIEHVKTNPLANTVVPAQEKGIKLSNSIPYQVYADGYYDAKQQGFVLNLKSKTEVFGKQTAGSPFNLYFPGKTSSKDVNGLLKWENMRLRSYAVQAQGEISDLIALNTFENKIYHLRVYGPNGFYREFKGDHSDPSVKVLFEYQRNRLYKNKLTGNVELTLINERPEQLKEIMVTDLAYGGATKTIKVSGESGVVVLDLSKSYSWYDFSIKVKGHDQYEQRFAGRVETGISSFSDPFMGRVIG